MQQWHIGEWTLYKSFNDITSSISKYIAKWITRVKVAIQSVYFVKFRFFQSVFIKVKIVTKSVTSLYCFFLITRRGLSSNKLILADDLHRNSKLFLWCFLNFSFIDFICGIFSVLVKFLHLRYHDFHFMVTLEM